MKQLNNWQTAIVMIAAFGFCGVLVAKAQDNADQERIQRGLIVKCHDMQVQYDMIMKRGTDREKIETIYYKNPAQCYYIIGEDDPFSEEWKTVETNNDFDRVYHNIDERAMKKVIQ